MYNYDKNQYDNNLTECIHFNWLSIRTLFCIKLKRYYLSVAKISLSKNVDQTG
jgi:hypothetical protein